MGYGVVRDQGPLGVATLTAFFYTLEEAQALRDQFEAEEADFGPMFNFRVAQITVLPLEVSA